MNCKLASRTFSIWLHFHVAGPKQRNISEWIALFGFWVHGAFFCLIINLVEVWQVQYKRSIYVHFPVIWTKFLLACVLPSLNAIFDHVSQWVVCEAVTSYIKFRRGSTERKQYLHNGIVLRSGIFLENGRYNQDWAWIRLPFIRDTELIIRSSVRYLCIQFLAIGLDIPEMIAIMTFGNRWIFFFFTEFWL